MGFCRVYIWGAKVDLVIFVGSHTLSPLRCCGIILMPQTRIGSFYFLWTLVQHYIVSPHPWELRSRCVKEFALAIKLIVAKLPLILGFIGPSICSFSMFFSIKIFSYIKGPIGVEFFALTVFVKILPIALIFMSGTIRIRVNSESVDSVINPVSYISISVFKCVGPESILHSLMLNCNLFVFFHNFIFMFYSLYRIELQIKWI